MKKSGGDSSEGWQIIYLPQVLSIDIRRLDPAVGRKIKYTIDSRLLANPFLYGRPLRARLKGARRLRVGDWRVVYDVEGRKVRILAIGHRSDIYQIVIGRIS